LVGWHCRTSSQLLEGQFEGDLASICRKAFVCHDQFVAQFQEHFIEAAQQASRDHNDALLKLLSPIWNDMLVVCDFNQNKASHLDFFPAAAFAAYHEAPLLLFPTIPEDEEGFLDKSVSQLEHELIAMATRGPPNRSIAFATDEFTDRLQQYGCELARLIFPSDVQATRRSIL
jgi:hypothetical protein